MGDREKLLAGKTTINREEFDARKDSEGPATLIRSGVEREPTEWESGAAGESGTRVQADTDNLQADESSLEELLRTQVTSKYLRRDALESEISDLEVRVEVLQKEARGLYRELHILEGVLAHEYDDTGGDRNAKDPIPQAGPGLKAEEGED